ncbi:hypothetical protein TRFO_37813 [Tritrichomonas foetus]|uniref:Uncharacterized protein n=1 Tax=Tritrichomonas foetus TaxID=1144522 RepID=A0A1J4JA49_9EUKA|nr:hypothetical protein TRFO_37813 [Tritrichomonas foetus]|eukprot:OHS96062.1 hypothetical protein TRFO_37813 [Tritrichomonas foetus]
MSAQKITELLHNHAMIDYNLISDSLSDILCEMCQLINDQGIEIDILKKEIPKFAIKAEIDEKMKIEKETITSVQTGMTNVSEATKQKFDTIAQTIQLNVNKINSQFVEMKKQIDTDIDDKYKELQGEFYIANQQIKDLTASMQKHKTMIDENAKTIGNIQEFLNKGQDQTLETLSAKITTLSEKVERIDSTHHADKKTNDAYIESIKNDLEKFKEVSSSEFKFLEGDLKELRRLVVDAPSIDLDGVTDTEALIRAIQRDSRRIDGFNETINGIRDENNEMRSLFTELTNGFQKLQLNVMDFVTEHNRAKKDIIALTQDNSEQCRTLNKNFGTCFSNIQNVLDTTLNGMNLVSNTFVQIFSFLGKITTRPLPMFTAFDDSLLEFQRLSDSINAQNERFDEINKNEEKKTPRIVPNNTFKVPMVTIAQVPEAMASKQSALHKLEFNISTKPASSNSENTPANNENQFSETNSVTSRNSSSRSNHSRIANNRIMNTGVDLELRQNVKDLQSKVDESLATVTHLKDTVEAKIERKTDTVAMERMMDKIRVMISKLRDQVNTQNKTIMTCVQRNEAETLIQQVLNTMNTGGETAAGANHFECLMCGRPKSSLTGNLPRLSNVSQSSQNPYEVLYGKSFESSTQSGAFPSTSQSERRNAFATSQSDRPRFTAQSNNVASRMKTPLLRKI